MPSLIYSFAQLEAFTAVVECKSLQSGAPAGQGPDDAARFN